MNQEMENLVDDLRKEARASFLADTRLVSLGRRCCRATIKLCDIVPAKLPAPSSRKARNPGAAGSEGLKNVFIVSRI